MNDDFLIRFRKPPSPDFAAALYQRISQPLQTQTTHQVMRFAALSLPLLAILTVTLLFSPSARTFAQALLKQVGGYAFNLGVPQTLDASRVPGPITIVRTSSAVSIELTSNAIAAEDAIAAGDLAGFTVRVPSYLPSGYIPMGGGWSVTTESYGVAVTNGYFDIAKDFFFVTQWKVAEGGLKTYTREQIVDVTVRGRSGVWLPDTTSPKGNNALVWEENGITYSLISSSLPLEEMLKVAESLNR